MFTFIYLRKYQSCIFFLSTMVWEAPLRTPFLLYTWESGGLLQNRETGNPKNSWGGCWEECWGNLGCWAECWRRCCEGVFPSKGMRSSILASTPSSTPNFRSTLPSTLPSYFLGFPASLFCSRPPDSQLYTSSSYTLSFYMKGRRPTQKTTHPTKNSLHKQFAQTLLFVFCLF